MYTDRFQYHPSSLPRHGRRWVVCHEHDLCDRTCTARQIRPVGCQHGFPGRARARFGACDRRCHQLHDHLEMGLSYEVSCNRSQSCKGFNRAISVPLGVLALSIASVAIPGCFPYGSYSRNTSHRFSMETLNKIDILGSSVLLLATLALTAAFEEAGSRYSWRSAYFISLLVAGTVFWAVFSIWERHVTLSQSVREPVLPWRFFTERMLIGILL